MVTGLTVVFQVYPCRSGELAVEGTGGIAEVFGRGVPMRDFRGINTDVAHLFSIVQYDGIPVDDIFYGDCFLRGKMDREKQYA